MKIVKFKDGSFGIRRLTPIGYQYKDLVHSFWWFLGSEHFADCCRDLECAQKAYNKIKHRNKDKGQPI